MTCEILIMAGGFISFPIFTRLLSKEEYGIMNLISISLVLVEALSSVGLRHASQRFYSSYKDEKQLQKFYSTTILSSIAFGVLGTLIIFIISKMLSFWGIISNNVNSIFVVASFLIAIRILTKIIGCLFRVREMAKTYSVFAVLTKYIGMFLSIVFVMGYLYGIYGYFLGLVLGELLVLCVFWMFMVREMGYSGFYFSGDMLKEMVSYGFPMVLAGFAGTILTMGDRYLIGYFMSAEDVALYSVPYNLCSYVANVPIAAFDFAFVPMIMNEWSKKKHGENELHQQVNKVIKMYCIFALPIIFGVSALGERIVVLLASNKYSGASYILPYVLIGEMLKGLFTPLTIGLFFSKKTKVLAKLTGFCAIINIIMNIFLIPVLGLLGAAISTLFCYIILLVVGGSISSTYFKLKMPWYNITRYSICAIIMFFFIRFLDEYYIVNNLPIFILSGIFIFILSILVIDRELRITAINLIKH